MKIEDCRKEIDRIDREIVDAFIRRAEVSRKISEIKKNESLPILNQERENEVLENVSSMVKDEYKPYVEELYIKIMKLSKDIQREGY